ncbi:hypothetical protein JCM11641_008343 [Rhodosporidiobolus odoratus]
MATEESQDAFHLGRLRLVRLPPASIAIPGGSKKPITIPVELTVGVTDDYGVDLMFDSLNLQIELLDAMTLNPPTNIGLRLEDSLSPASARKNVASFTFSPSRGPFHSLRLNLGFSALGTSRIPQSALCFRLSVAPSSAVGSSLSDSRATKRMRTLIGEEQQSVLESWEDKKYVFMSLTSGPVEVMIEGKEVKVANEKVQVALRTIHLPCAPSRSPPTSQPALASASTSVPASTSSQLISIVERPGLNNSTGQRLWDCAIGLSAFFSLYPGALDASSLLPFPSSPVQSNLGKIDIPCAKRPRLDSTSSRMRRIKVIELGAGCALASLAIWRLLPDADILATDVEATVSTTLRENLAANSLEETGAGRKGGQAIVAEVLDWGEVAPEHVQRLAGDDVDSALTLIGSDILYNPSSHALLLSTLLSFLRPRPRSPSSAATSTSSTPTQHRRALIAYKHRTEGDDGSFPLARSAGLEVKEVWKWGGVGVWAFS